MKWNVLRRTGSAALCLLLVGSFACGCAQEYSPAGSGAVSQQQSGSTDAASTVLDDGSLRILYGATQSQGNTVLLGGNVLCKASPSDTLWLLQDAVTGETNYYLYAYNDASCPSGRRTTIYNKLGAEVLTFDWEADAYLTNGYLTVRQSGSLSEYDGTVQPGTLRVYDLHTAGDDNIKGECSVPSNAVDCFAVGDHLVFSIYEYADTGAQSDTGEMQITGCSVQILDKSGNIVFERESCTPASLYSTSSAAISNWMVLYANDGNPYNSTGETALYRPSDGMLFENYEQTCDGAVVCLKNANGQYELRDLSGDATAVLGTFDALPCRYIPDKVLLYSDESRSYQLYDLSTSEVMLIEQIYGTEDELAIYTTDGTLLLYDTATGEELLHASAAFSTPAENGYNLEPLGNGYVWLQKYGGVNSESEIYIYGPDGFAADLSAIMAQYSYVSALTTTTDHGPLLAASYRGPGSSSLYDVIDCNGNVLLHGLANCHAAYPSGELPSGYFYAQRGYYYGWMDTSGNWLYCENLFDTLVAEDGISYIYG